MSNNYDQECLLILFPHKHFPLHLPSQYVPTIKLLLKSLLAFFHGSFEWRQAEFLYFSEPFLARRLKETQSSLSHQRKQVYSYRYPHKALREARTNRKWMESFAEEHIKLLIGSDIVVVTGESDDYGICSL